jgi:hypothetical protein
MEIALPVAISQAAGWGAALAPRRSQESGNLHWISIIDKGRDYKFCPVS